MYCLYDLQARIKIARRNVNYITYADDTTLMAESQEELKKLLMKMKEESEKGGLKLNIQKTKIMIHLVLSLDGKLMGVKMEVATDFIFLGSKITTDSDCSHKIKRCLLFGRIAMSDLYSWRHHFMDQGLSSQSYGFFSCQAHM